MIDMVDKKNIIGNDTSNKKLYINIYIKFMNYIYNSNMES
jgi:hypothetical protein